MYKVKKLMYSNIIGYIKQLRQNPFSDIDIILNEVNLKSSCNVLYYI